MRHAIPRCIGVALTLSLGCPSPVPAIQVQSKAPTQFTQQALVTPAVLGWRGTGFSALVSAHLMRSMLSPMIFFADEGQLSENAFSFTDQLEVLREALIQYRTTHDTEDPTLAIELLPILKRIRTGTPVYVTSVELSGQPDLTDVAEAATALVARYHAESPLAPETLARVDRIIALFEQIITPTPELAPALEPMEPVIVRPETPALGTWQLSTDELRTYRFAKVDALASWRQTLSSISALMDADSNPKTGAQAKHWLALMKELLELEAHRLYDPGLSQSPFLGHLRRLATTLEETPPQSYLQLPKTVREFVRVHEEVLQEKLAATTGTRAPTGQSVRYFGGDAGKLWIMSLAELTDVEKREDAPKPLRPLFDAGIRVTSDPKKFEKTRQRSDQEQWYLFERAHMTYSGLKELRGSDADHVREMGKALQDHSISGRALANAQLRFRFDPLRQTYRLVYRSKGLKADARTIQKILKHTLRSYQEAGQSLPRTITIQGMLHMQTTYMHNHMVFDVEHRAVTVVLPRGHTAIYVDIHTLREIESLRKLRKELASPKEVRFSGAVDHLLIELEPLLHEITHAIAPADIRSEETPVIVHSFVNVLQTIAAHAGIDGVFSTSFVWATLHALNPSGERAELKGLGDWLERLFLRAERNTTSIVELRHHAQAFLSQLPSDSTRVAHDLAHMLTREAGISASLAPRVAHAMAESRSVHFISDDSRDNTPKYGETVGLESFARASSRLYGFFETVSRNYEAFKQGKIGIRLPEGLADSSQTLESLIPRLFPESYRRMQLAEVHGLFDTLPVAFDQQQSMGPYVATIDRNSENQPFRFLDYGGFGAKAFGENQPWMISELLEHLPNVVDRYPLSDYATDLSLKFVTRMGSIAPDGCPKVFLCNTGAESVENAIKAALFQQELGDSVPTDENAFLIHADGAFHGRSLGALAATRSKTARVGFPTFNWPDVPYPYARFEEGRMVYSSDLNKRELASLKTTWRLIILGRNLDKNPPPKKFEALMESIDAFLEKLYKEDLAGITDREERKRIKAARVRDFVETARAHIAEKHKIHAENVTGMIIEPFQGEGGIRIASARYFQRLRLLTMVYSELLMFDEVQTGMGRTGTLFAHEQFDLPAPPDIVVTAKIAQMGVVFVSDEIAKFFEAEKRFNTTWAGEPAGMIRAMRYLDQMDLPRIRTLGEYALNALVALQKQYPQYISSVRGRGLMLGLSMQSPDKSRPSLLRDQLQEAVFRRGLIINKAGTETLRFYPRYDDSTRTIDEAIQILKEGIESLRPPVSHAHPSARTLNAAA